MKRIWLLRKMALLLTGVMIVGLLTGCGNKKADNTKKETDNTKQEQQENPSVTKEITPSPSTTEEVSAELTYPLNTDIELSIWVKDQLNLYSTYASAEESPFHSGLSEKTGVKLDWQFPAQGADVNTAYNLMLQEEELPNIIFGSTIANVSNGTTLLQDGLIYDLTDYLPLYAPDYWEYINRPENEETLKALKTADGRLYSVAFIAEGDYNITYIGPVIRHDWLEECNLEEPVTLEDWENVLVTFKEKYDAVFSFALSRFNFAGISNGTGAFCSLSNKYYVDENNNVQCAAAQEEWKDMLTVLHRWYDMGLLDPDFATMDEATLRSKVLNNEVGVSITAMSQISNWCADAKAENTGADWQGFGYPRTAPGAPTTYIPTRRTPYSGTTGALITTSCSEEELIAALQFLNYGYTEEGIKYWNFGEEGVTYTIDANGDVQWTELITEDPAGISEAVKKYTGVYGGGISIQTERFVQIKNEEASANAVFKWIENTVARDYALPTLAFSEEENAKNADLGNVINTYVAEMGLKFVTGDESLDKFDAFVEELNSLGLPEVIKIQQGAFDRYLAQ